MHRSRSTLATRWIAHVLNRDLCTQARKAVLEKYHTMEDYTCCQNYVPKCCCITTGGMCKGSAVGLCCEGCLCPIFSLSIARLHLMDSKQVRPDPCDYQIIACSNCLQLLSCLLDIVAIFVAAARDAAEILDCIADLFTCSVAGCMGAQVQGTIPQRVSAVGPRPSLPGSSEDSLWVRRCTTRSSSTRTASRIT